MKTKQFISLTLGLAFLVLSTTGLLLYLVPHTKTTTLMHTIFGLLFLGYAIFHIINNFPSLWAYTRSKTTKKIQPEFFIGFALVAIFVTGAWFQLKPFEAIEEFGEGLRKGKKVPPPPRITFNQIEIKKDKGKEISIFVQKNKDKAAPIVAIWVEDSARRFVENLFVPASIVADSLPTWKGKTQNQTPTYDKTTPESDFMLTTTCSAAGNFFVCLEIKSGNQTEYYEATLNPNTELAKIKSPNATLLNRAWVETK